MMEFRLEERSRQRLLVLDPEGPALSRVQDIIDLIAEALPRRVSMIVLPVARLDPAFFQLRSGVAGDFAQKIVNYRLRLAVIGDISHFTVENKALADFVREANRGGSIFFLPDLDALAEKLDTVSPEAAVHSGRKKGK